jgi:hypothetical protein
MRQTCHRQVIISIRIEEFSTKRGEDYFGARERASDGKSATIGIERSGDRGGPEVVLLRPA